MAQTLRIRKFVHVQPANTTNTFCFETVFLRGREILLPAKSV